MINSSSPSLKRKLSPQQSTNIMSKSTPGNLKYCPRKKIIPSTFFVEPLSESTESESSDDSKSNKLPTPVDILNKELNVDDISSSSEIEIAAGEDILQHNSPQSEGISPSTDEQETTLKFEVKMNSSLPSYDLAQLFAAPNPKDSGGESMMTFEEEDEEKLENSSTLSEEDDEIVINKPNNSNNSNNTEPNMTDSLSAVSWSDDFDD